VASEPSEKPADLAAAPGAEGDARPAAPEQAAAPGPNAARASASPAADAEADVAARQPTEAAPARDSEGWIGRIVDDRYRVVRRLGEGGMGAVFVAEHLTLRKPVAFKVVRAELAGNGEVAARFAREAMATAQFEHPHVASAIDYGTLPEGGAYFVMQLVRGRSLRAFMSNGRKLPWRRACEIAAQVADALSAAKSAGIIHRDLKPDNILVERRDDGSDLVKVLDFGIAHVAPRETSGADAQTNRALTRVGTVMGTPGYMAPEQAVGDKVDHRADLYALGVVLWESITGQELWQGPDLTSVVTRQMTEPVPRLRDVVDDPTLHPELDDVVQRLTARAIGDRPEHAAEVRDALRRLAHTSAPPLSAARALAALQQLRDSSVGPWVRKTVDRYSAQPQTTRRVQAGAVALAAIALVLAILPSGDGPAPNAPPPETASQPAAGNAAPAAQPAPAETQPTAMDKMAKAAAAVVEKAAPKLRVGPLFPPELAVDVKIMLDGESQRDRRSAAEKVFAYEPAAKVSPHLRAIAELEKARGCKTRKQAIANMKQQGDLRYLPPLQRLARSPRSGCGFLNLADCLSCIRNDLREAIAELEKKLPQPGSSEHAPAP
jgi:serine/threonine-protein kinase